MTGRRLAMWVAVVGLAMTGCALNQEQPVRNGVSNRGSEVPQAVTINVNLAGGNQAGKGNVSTTQPTRILADGRRIGSQPAGNDSSAGDGTASSGGTLSGGNVIIAPIWIDSSSTARAETGSQSPRTGSIAPRLQGDQRPETQVNPAVPISIGAMPSASASTTSSFKAPATSGAQTFDQSGARNMLKAMGLNDQQAAQVFELFKQLTGAASQPAG